VRAKLGLLAVNGICDVYGAGGEISGPTRFGPGVPFPGFEVGVGDGAGIGGNTGTIRVPENYTSGDALANTLSLPNRSFATIGVTPGTYVWTWITDRTTGGTDSLTLEIVATTALPEPATAPLPGAGPIGRAAARRRHDHRG